MRHGKHAPGRTMTDLPAPRHDSIHPNAENWKACPSCSVDCPVSSTTCFNCGAAFDPETVREPERNRGPVIGTCRRCGTAIHWPPGEHVGPVAGHGCRDGFRHHHDGEGIELEPAYSDVFATWRGSRAKAAAVADGGEKR